MRGKWNHIEPENIQATPGDNNRKCIEGQVKAWEGGASLINPEIAMQIAAEHHSPAETDRGITAFASTGTILASLAGELDRRRSEVAESPETQEEFPGVLSELDALIAYVKAAGGPVVFDTWDSYAAQALAHKIEQRRRGYTHTFTPELLIGVVHALQDVAEQQELDDETLDAAAEFLRQVGERFGIRVEK